MNRRRKLLCTGLVGFGTLVLVAARLVPGSAQQASPPSQPTRHAVALLRVVNDAESHYHTGSAAYATWDQLSKSGIPQGIVAQTEERLSKTGAPEMARPRFNLDSPQPLPGYVLSLYLSADGSHYLCSLRDDGKEACGPSFFTDDSGLILQAKAIGCR